MEIVRLVYCANTSRSIYQLVNNDGNFYWKQNHSQTLWDSVSEILPLHIDSRDNRYLSFCRGMYEIRFMEGDL